jgi:hypothetical protein
MTKKLFTKTALACFLACLITAIACNRIGLRYFQWLISQNILNELSLALLIASLLYIFIWLSKAMRRQEDTSLITAFWQNALRYILALDMMVFGVCKFFHIQFNTPLALLDNPLNTIPDADLMWAFFGHSRPFTYLIASLEIIGASMLLYRKTRLLAVIFMLPICLNIFALDVFYNGVVTSVYIGIEIAGYIYLLLIEQKRLYQFFFVEEADSPHFTFKNQALRNVIKLSVVIFPAMLMVIYHPPQYYPDINGKYEVKTLVIDSTSQKLPSTDSILTKVYIDKNDIVLEYNGYDKRFIGSYKYNEATHELEAWWRYPWKHPENLFAKILPGKDPEKKVLIGHMGKQTLKIDLQRVNKGI